MSTTGPASPRRGVRPLDGRPINQDYYGYVAWDFMPTGFGEVKRVEVLSGAASAVWGAYAMNGVVNILTKSPREMAGTTVTLGVGSFDRSGGIAPSDTGSLYYVNATNAGVVNDRGAARKQSCVGRASHDQQVILGIRRRHRSLNVTSD